MVKINIFYVFSAVLALIFIGFLWLVFLPLFLDTDAYSAMKNMVTILSLVMGVVVVLTLLMAKLPASK